MIRLKPVAAGAGWFVKPFFHKALLLISLADSDPILVCTAVGHIFTNLCMICVAQLCKNLNVIIQDLLQFNRIDIPSMGVISLFNFLLNR